MLKSLSNLHAFSSISQPLAGKSWSQTTVHTWDIWLEECVYVRVPCRFPSWGVFSWSPGCMEVPAPGLLHIKATCLCFSFLQACHTCSSHACTPLSFGENLMTPGWWLSWFYSMWKINWFTAVLETFIATWKLFETCMMTQRRGEVTRNWWKKWLDTLVAFHVFIGEHSMKHLARVIFTGADKTTLKAYCRVLSFCYNFWKCKDFLTAKNV